MYLRDIASLIRIPYMFLYLLGLSVGYANGLGHSPKLGTLLLGLVSLFLLWTACYTLNDLRDMEADFVNGLDRPLPSRRASPSQFRVLFLTTSLAGFVLLAMMPRCSSPLLAICWLAGVAYSSSHARIRTKPLVSLLPSAGSFLLVVLAGSYLRGSPSRTTILVAFLFFALILIAGNSKDIGDVAGDSRFDRTTLPMVIGPKGTAMLALASSVVVGSALLVSQFVLQLEPSSLIFSGIGVFLLVAGSIRLATLEFFTATLVRRINVVQSLGMAIILFSFLVGSLG